MDPLRRTDGPSALYDRGFFRDISPGSSRSAARIVPELIELIAPTSVIDVGCGSGIWLAEFQRRGVDAVCSLQTTGGTFREVRLCAAGLSALQALGRRRDRVVVSTEPGYLRRRDYIAARQHLRTILERQSSRVLRLVHPDNDVEKTQMLVDPTLNQLLRALPRAMVRTMRRSLWRLTGKKLA
jgi:hypothetical protein